MQYDDFRETLNSLEANGDDGFEGLMAVVLGHITGVRFTLASSGTQQGRDGQSIFDGNSVAFEAKRYDKSISKDKILTKFVELGSTGTSPPEMFIIGATSDISSQHVNVMQASANNMGMHLLILAWPKNQLPELACAICMAAEKATSFINEKKGVARKKLLDQMDEIMSHPDYGNRCNEITKALAAPNIAPALALGKNRTWLYAAFSDYGKARQCFGQALIPLDKSGAKILERDQLKEDLENAIYDQSKLNVVALLGGDGNGKSWVFGQMWAACKEPALTIILTPNDFDQITRESFQELLIKKLIAQTDDLDVGFVRDRWAKHFDRWRKGLSLRYPNLIVFIDGINQRINMDWALVVDIMGGLLEGLRGRLVISCREFFFKEKIKNVASKFLKITVPQWSKGELDLLLGHLGVSSDDMSSEVRRSLLNPRIFGVAAQLYKRGDIQGFGELSVNRLLFEHIRQGGEVVGCEYTEREFKKLICDHAKSIVSRVRSGESEYYSEFEVGDVNPSAEKFLNDLLITSSGRFFEVIHGEPGKYILCDDGLHVALGLMLASTACELRRKDKNLEEGLAQILEPISALDLTADVLLNAIHSAVLDGCESEIVSALIESLVGLQNLNSDRYQEFKGFFRQSSNAYFSSLESSFLSSRNIPSIFWLSDAILENKKTPEFRGIYKDWINKWFRLYSLSPERLVGHARMQGDTNEYHNELAERESELRALVENLTPLEVRLLKDMCLESRGDYSELNRWAINLVAREGLEIYSESLALWCFGNAINGGYRSASDDVFDLVSLNVADWVQTRDSLRAIFEKWAVCGLSITGKRAVISGLRATGDSQDAASARALVHEIEGETSQRVGWRLVENYCSVDPCDPITEEPENIAETLEKFRTLDLSTLMAGRMSSEHDHFFGMALTGLARFRSHEAIEVIQSLAEDVVSRSLEGHTYAVFKIALHSSALNEKKLDLFLSKAAKLSEYAVGQPKDIGNNLWSKAQFLLFAALPHLTGLEQLKALLAHPEDNSPLWDLKYTFKPILSEFAEQALDDAICSLDVTAQFRILFFAEHCGSIFSERFNRMVEVLTASEHDLVRLSALSYATTVNDRGVLASVVNSHWSISTASGQGKKIEQIYGSLALVKAAVMGLISVEECFDRISPEVWGDFADGMGDAALSLMSLRLQLLVKKALDFTVPVGLPYINKSVGDLFHPISISVSSRPLSEQADMTLSNDVDKSFEAFVERTKADQLLCDDFFGQLCSSDAGLIIEFLDSEVITALLGYDKDTILGLTELVLQAGSSKLRNLKPFVLALAESLLCLNERLSRDLLEKVSGVEGHVNGVIGHARVPLESVVIWRCCADGMMRDIVYSRLDAAKNDYETSMEVLAAYQADKVDTIKAYIMDRRVRPEALYRARAASVSSFCFAEDWAIETIDMLAQEIGFLGDVHKAARYVLDRHIWSMYWLGELVSARTNERVWRASVIFAKIADARFFLNFENFYFNGDELCQNYVGMTLRQVGDRVKKWKTTREKKLFGCALPDPLLLPKALL